MPFRPGSADFDNTRGTVRAGEPHAAVAGDLLNHDGNLESHGNAALNVGGLLGNLLGRVAAGSGGTLTVGKADGGDLTWDQGEGQRDATKVL